MLVFSLVLFISGCNGDDSDDGGTTEALFLGGTDGVSVDFKDLEPRTSFEKGELVDFTLVLTNAGEYDIPQSSISVQLD